MTRLIGMALFSIVFASSSASAQPNFSFFEPVNPPRKIQVMVHRGMAIAAPENSAAAIKMCAQDFCEWAEIDLRLTKDGFHVIIHDDSVDRTTSGTGRVADFTLAELKNLDAGACVRETIRRKPTDDIARGACPRERQDQPVLGLQADRSEAPRRGSDRGGMEPQAAVVQQARCVGECQRASRGAVPGMTKYRPKIMPLAAFVQNVAPAAVESTPTS